MSALLAALPPAAGADIISVVAALRIVLIRKTLCLHRRHLVQYTVSKTAKSYVNVKATVVHWRL